MTQLERPNILLISMDDAFAFWRFRNAFGVQLQTPNLDRICARATAFHAAYCQVPVCGPSRSSFLSGLAPHQTGIFDNYSEIFEMLRPDQMWSYRLKEAGYYCSTAGKVHHGYRPRPPEIHDALYSHESRKCYFGPKSGAPAQNFGGALVGLGTTDPKDDRKYYDHFSSEDALRFLSSYDGEAPFYREVGFHNPHPPFKTPARFKEMYAEEDFVMPPEWRDGKDPDAFADQAFPANLDLSNDKFWRKTVRNYFSGYSHADWHVGRVWDALQASKHAKNTIVIITADHGYHMGDKGRFRKYTLWEEAAGVPLIIYDPSQDEGRVVEDPVALLDVGQTVLDYVGLEAMQCSPGRSLRAQVEGVSAPERAVPTFWFGSAAIRQGDYRYIAYQDGSEQLFDLKSDPWQLRDIAPNHPERANLRRALAASAAEYGMSLCDGENCRPGPSLYVSITEGGAQPATPPTLGQIAFEPPDPDMPDFPGYRRYFLRPRQNMTVKMPNAYRELFYAGDIGDGADSLHVHCNDLGTHLDFMGGHKRFHLTVYGGRGDDRIETAQETMTVFLQAGDNVIDAGFSDTTIYGGSGYDVIDCQRAENDVYGGTGDALIRCGTGRDTVHTGDGTNQIFGGKGAAEIIVNGGCNRIEIDSDGTVSLRLLRTGLPQEVIGFTGGAVDISDWQVLGETRLITQGEDALIMCGTERVRFVQTDEAVLRHALGHAL
ncbi:sulfatase-like hydrolase/transferase [uncultured Thioclava sp.]|uniref:sulfatase-like hydrolase/transferase n=1 Tax=uncultured Thioclava sp. TaxID=473858 RepID=UPI0025CCD7D6|nr:sulfatase-like hydrolase/transferase [uncultured Thioclava sp.]